MDEDSKKLAQEKNGPSSSKMQRQQPLLAVTDSVRSDPTARSKGFVESAIDVDALTVTFFWNGPVPAEIRDRVESVKAPFVSVEFREVPYTLEQLIAEARRILRSYPPAVTAGPNRSFTGLKIVVEADNLSAESIGIESEFPIEIERRGARIPAVRYADSAPFWGGALIISEAGEADPICTAGWAVNLPQGGRGAVTASHCPAPDNIWKAGVSDRVYGTSVAMHARTDSRLLTGQTYDPVLYTGAWDSSMGTGIQVHGWSEAELGEYICIGGALSGEVCNDVLVYDVYTFWEYGDGLEVGPGFETLKQSRIASMGQGDSGGPAYRNRTSNGLYKAVILGMNSGVDLVYEDTCQGVQERRCSLKGFHVNVNSINSGLGVTPVTQ